MYDGLGQGNERPGEVGEDKGEDFIERWTAALCS